MVFGATPADLYRREDQDKDTSFSGRFVQQRKLRMIAQEAALKEIATSIPRRLLAYNTSFNCTDVKIGDTGLFYKATNKKSAPCRRGPAKILDIDKRGVTAKFQSQTFKVARFRAGEKVESKDVEDAESDLLR